MIRVGVDIGGTFTDVVLERGDKLHSIKILTDYAAPEQAILDGIADVTQAAGVQTGDIDLIIHGTTLATNALIARSGAKTAFITTKGFRDVIEMRKENRFEQYDLNLKLPEPLVPRNHRFVLDERIDAGGGVLKALDMVEVEALLEMIVAEEFESVAIGFLHSYLNADHEHLVQDALAARHPGLSVSISSQVSPQMREFERFSTVCANAYVKPQMASYLGRLRDRLQNIGCRCPVYMIHSGGGLISVETATEFPVRLVESGPAGGAIFAAHIAARYNLDHVLSYDMGGTTAKICLIENQTPKTTKTFEVARTYRFKKGSGIPISVPVIEMVEIGAGGGSIASIDAMQRIQIGPESAGSDPGPACYQRGGKQATVTDADLLLGRLDADNFAGGSIKLSVDRSVDAVQSAIGNCLAISPVESAYGICELVDENMTNAARVHAVENGKNIADYTMIAFGGAAPLHATRLCGKLGINKLLIPPGAGVGSAIGFLRTPFGFEAVRSSYMRLSSFDAGQINRVLRELTEEADGFIAEDLRDGQNLQREQSAYMRYAGQGWEIPVPIPRTEFCSSDATSFQAWFETAYKEFFGRPIDDLDIEIVSWSVRTTTPAPAVATVSVCATSEQAKTTASRQLYDPGSNGFVTAKIVERSALTPGIGVTGPAIITERETSTILSPGSNALMQSDGCLLVSVDAVETIQ